MEEKINLKLDLIQINQRNLKDSCQIGFFFLATLICWFSGDLFAAAFSLFFMTYTFGIGLYNKLKSMKKLKEIYPNLYNKK
jgi:hypothetical protein